MVRRRDWFFAAVEWGLLVALFATYLWMQHGIWGDGAVRGDAIRALLDKGRVGDSWYSTIGPLFATPLLMLDRALGEPDTWFCRYNTFVAMVAFAVSTRFLRPHLGARLHRWWWLLLLSASLFPLPLLTFYGENFTAWWVGLGLMLVAYRHTWGWALVVLGGANTPATALGIGLVAVFFAVDERKLRHLLGPVALVAVILAENALRRGSAFATGGYENTGEATRGAIMPYVGLPGFSYPLFFGVTALLVSFGRGLLWWQPGLWLWPSAKTDDEGLRRALRAFALLMVGLLLVYGRWWAWHGAHWSGPRFLLLGSFPAALLLAQGLLTPDQPGWRVPTLLVLLVASVYSGINSAVFNWFQTLDRSLACQVADGALCSFTWEFSALVRPFLQPVSTNESGRVFVGLALATGGWMLLTHELSVWSRFRALFAAGYAAARLLRW